MRIATALDGSGILEMGIATDLAAFDGSGILEMSLTLDLAGVKIDFGTGFANMAAFSTPGGGIDIDVLTYVSSGTVRFIWPNHFYVTDKIVTNTFAHIFTSSRLLTFRRSGLMFHIKYDINTIT